MDFDKMKTELLAERNRIDTERTRIDSILDAMDQTPAPKNNNRRQPAAHATQPTKRKMSQATKNKIAAATRARWEQRKKKHPKTAKAA